MNKVFFTSDNHFGHENILKKFCPNTRQGRDVEEMNRLMIAQWQSQVEPSDTVYMLGDVFFCQEEKALNILNQLPGQKVLVYGNHDKVIKNSPRIKSKFASIQDYLELKVCGTNVILFHFPMYEWNRMHHGSYHLYGHIHSRYGEQEHPAIKGRCMDVGIDSRPLSDMTLWSWDEVNAILSKREVRAHHEKVS